MRQRRILTEKYEQTNTSDSSEWTYGNRLDYRPPIGEFSIQGHDNFGKPHLWRADGFWNEYGYDPHPLDIMREAEKQTEATNVIKVDFQTEQPK